MKQQLFTYILSVFFLTSYSQHKYCADSSIRIKYSSDSPNVYFNLNINDEIFDKNIFSGTYRNSDYSDQGFVQINTTRGDSVLWSKKYESDTNIFLGCTGTYILPEKDIIISGYVKKLNSTYFTVSRTDSNGNILWSKQLLLGISGLNYYLNPNTNNECIYISNNSIYFFLNTSSSYNIIGKIDLNGNILWSKNLISQPIFSTGSISQIFERDGIIYTVANKYKQIPGGIPIIFQGLIVTKLNESNGNILESSLLSVIPDSYIKGLYGMNLQPYPDGNFSISGYACVLLPDGSISPGQPYTRFNLILNSSILIQQGAYFKTNIPPDQTYQFDVSTKRNSVFLYNNISNQTKYFLIYDRNQTLYRSRKFSIQSNPVGTSSTIKLDDKQNIHFLYNYKLGNQSISEYARISDLAPANTLQCFGQDTASIFQQFPMQVTKEPFTWDVVQNNVLSSLPVTVYTEDFPINQEVVCKQVSYCDSLKILGTPAVCIGSGAARFSTYLNPQCLKSLNWDFDTSYATLVNYEADSAITLNFKKTGSFYLKAEVNNCVVNDSIRITVTNPKTSLQLNKNDSLLCRGDSLLLHANPGFHTYQWQDGSTDSSYSVTTPGLYKLTATDYCGSVFTDSILVKPADTSLNISSNYSICPYDSAKLLLPANATNISWQPVSSGLLRENTLLLFPPQTTVYQLQVKMPPGCVVQKNITVIKDDCPEWVRFPSAFTPNGDGLNDLFKPGISGTLQAYNLKIFNRNGQLIVNTDNPFEGWDGTFKSKKQNSGIFVFLCRYSFPGGESRFVKGTVMLIR